MKREDVETLLERHGIQPTRPRIDAAEVLLSRKQHVTADQLLEQLNTKHSQVSRATVYNTLKLFVRQGVIRQVMLDGDRTLYDSNTSHHYHMYNVDTGELTDIPAGALPQAQDLGLPEGAEVEGMDVVVRVRTPAH